MPYLTLRINSARLICRCDGPHQMGRGARAAAETIAVDAQRTRNVGELESALGQAEPGETVYLTVVSGGRRGQVHVNRP
jgi:hypothetical protein